MPSTWYPPGWSWSRSAPSAARRNSATPRPTPRPVSSPAAIRQVPVTAAARACPPAPGGAAAPVALLAGGAAAAGQPPEHGGAGATGQGQGQGQVELTALPPAGLPVHAAARSGRRAPARCPC